MASKGTAFRKARPADARLILEMENRCFDSRDAFEPERIHYFLKNPARSIITDVIEQDHRPAGWAVYFTRKKSRTIRMYSLCIVPEMSGRGIAQNYVAERLKDFKRFSRAVLEVRVGNSRAIHLYEKAGFRIYKTLKGYYPGGEDGLRMALTIR